MCVFSPASLAQSSHQISTYDDTQYSEKGNQRHEQIEFHKASLKQLDDDRLFDTLQARLMPKLSNRHQKYFRMHKAYKLLFFSAGDLFGNTRTDYAFIVYDRQNARISILLYNDSTDQYGELYRDIKVENGLATAKCNYFAFGTLDYQLGNEIRNIKNALRENSYLVSTLEYCKCTNISTDPALSHLKGCFARSFNKNNVGGFTALCIATSFAYNNWECLKYDRSRNIFIIFYGQASAD